MSTLTHDTTDRVAWRKREHLWPGLILVGMTMLGWAYTLQQITSAPQSEMAGDLGGMRMAVESASLADLSLFLLGWLAMMAAMMIPAAVPLILLYRTIGRKRMGAGRARAGVAVLLVGYFGVWTAAGLPVYGYDLVSGRFERLALLLPGLLLIAGGAYQFTALKRGCHARCSNPLFFLTEKWRPGAVGALRLGILHGVDCLGCCAGLMVGLVALGMMNLALMLTAAVIIFVEKTLPGGHWVARPLGVLMVASGLMLLGASLLGSGMTV